MKNLILCIIVGFLILFFPVSGYAAGKSKIFVIMSYESPQKNLWCGEVKDGIESVLKEEYDIDYFYMDTKANFSGAKQKAKQAYDIFKNSHYDGVIAVDDNAQKFFVVPYLKNKTRIPIMFCGVNAEPEVYGYPTSHISGMIERGHFRESIALVKQLFPEITNIGVIIKDSPSGKAIKNQIENESGSYLARIHTLKMVKSIRQLEPSSALDQCDGFIIAGIGGILDKTGAPMSIGRVVSYLTDTYQKPVIGANRRHIKSGALCAVIKSGKEQGIGAAEKLISALKGTPVSDIPVTVNFKGKRLINVTVLKRFKLSPKPIYLIGSELITTDSPE